MGYREEKGKKGVGGDPVHHCTGSFHYYTTGQINGRNEYLKCM